MRNPRTRAKPRDYLVYKIDCLMARKCYYGYSSYLSGRFTAHRRMLKNKTHHCKALQHDFNKYGEENFVFFVIKDKISENSAKKLESKLINASMKLGVCYNTKIENISKKYLKTKWLHVKLDSGLMDALHKRAINYRRTISAQLHVDLEGLF